MELTGKRPVMKKEKSAFKLWPAAAVIAASFLISRVCFLDHMLPAAAALAAALVSFRGLNVCLLPFMLLGLATLYPGGVSVWPGAGAVCGCGLFFACAGKIPFTLWQRGLISGAITVISRSVYCAASQTAGVTAGGLILEGFIGAALCAAFQVFLQMAKGEGPSGGAAGGLASICAVFMALVSGTGFSWMLLPAAMLLTLLSGYLLGPMEGLAAAFSSGAFLALCGGGSGAAFALAAGGLAAGLFKSRGKGAAALGFAAAAGAGALGFLADVTGQTGLVDSALSFYISLLAALPLFLLPGPWTARLEAALSRFLRLEAYEDRQRERSASARLKEQQKTFDQLAALFMSQDNRRRLMSCQFKAVAKALEHARSELSPASPRAPAGSGFRIQAARAGCAKNRGISGDSCLWAQIPGNRFAVVLSDGMGTGRIAAGESSLAVTTVIRLLEAGLEAELVLKLLNEIFLLNADREVFSTIDLGIFNGDTGQMKFYKIGAAPTFIRRRYSVETLAVSAMPLGIVDGLKMEYVTASLNPGDQVIMASDGVTDCLREDMSFDWLRAAISGIRSGDPQTMCDLIINQAAAHYGTREKDDLTVVALRVE